MTVIEDHRVRTDDALPPPASPATVGRRRYEPKHALPSTPGRDTTTMWLFLVLLLTSGFVAGTTAAFRASTTDVGNVFGSATLSNPLGQTLALKGSNLDLTITGLGGFDGGGAISYGSRWRYMFPTNVSKTGSSYGCSTTASAYPTDLTDSSTTLKTIDQAAITGFSDGRWMCVMAHTAYPATKPAAPAQQWYSQKDNPATSVQLGHVIQSVELRDQAGTSGRLQATDKVIVTFNQAVDATSRPTSGIVCSRNNTNTIFIGPSACNNAISEVSIAYLEPRAGVTVGNGNFSDTTWTWSGDGRTLTITLNSTSTVIVGGCTEASPVDCFRARTDLTVNTATALASANSPQRALCTTDDLDFDNGICWPNVIGKS